MRRADRLFRLVGLLRARRFATAAELATALEVSVRTVYRDVADLVASGVPIVGEAGVGYRLSRGFELPPLTFNTAELEALVLGSRMVESWGDAELAAAARSVIEKVEAVLPEPLKHVLEETALFAPNRPWAKEASQGLGRIRQAITEHRKLRLRYVDAGGEGSERTVRPLGLYFWGDRWSLAAWCELRTDYRNFRPDRIDQIDLLDDTFDNAGGVSLGGFMADMESRGEPTGRPS
jgi:predicted DNA-binding transcriptional regulator YafY